jgi:hypothetical protein
MRRKRSLIMLREGVYYTCFVLEGRRIRRSLKTSDRREAERAAAKIYADAVAGLVPGVLPLPGPLAEALSGLAADLRALAAQVEAGFAALATKLQTAEAGTDAAAGRRQRLRTSVWKLRPRDPVAV